MKLKRVHFDFEIQKNILDTFADICRRKEMFMKDRVKELIESDCVNYMNSEETENENETENELNEVLENEYEFKDIE